MEFHRQRAKDFPWKRSVGDDLQAAQQHLIQLLGVAAKLRIAKWAQAWNSLDSVIKDDLGRQSLEKTFNVNAGSFSKFNCCFGGNVAISSKSGISKAIVKRVLLLSLYSPQTEASCAPRHAWKKPGVTLQTERWVICQCGE